MKNKVFIITEAGVNHNGGIDIAKKLIDVALSARADAVKFQTFKTEGALFLQQSVDDVD
jgi:N,N'-diacetyllegionaminate synthase